MSSRICVHARDLQAGYGWGPLRRPALRGVDLEARSGTVTAVIGPNGAGKSTLFRVLLGFLAPSGGAVTVWGLEPRRYRRRHGVGFLPESTPTPAGWTALQLLQEGCDLQGMSSGERRRALAVAVERSGLEGRLLELPLSRLSKGTARRALLAYALLGAPRLVLLDEPLSGLDPEARTHLRTVVSDIAREGATVLLASHELEEVARMARVALVLTAGRITGSVRRPDTGVELEAALLGQRGGDRETPDRGTAPDGPGEAE